MRELEWDEVFIKGTIRIRDNKKQYKSEKLEKPRRYIKYQLNGKKKSYTFARVVWNCMHPDDLATPQDDVHHKDNDTLNDCPENLEKLSYSIHRGMKRNYSNTPEVWKMKSDNHLRYWREVREGLRPPPKRGKLNKVKWDRDLAFKLIDEGETASNVAKIVGVKYDTLLHSIRKRKNI
jgi:hypothetical protein